MVAPGHVPDYAHDIHAGRPILEELRNWLDGALRYPGQGLPERIQNLPSSAPGWSRLARNCPLGQKANILYNADAESQETAQILQLPGDEGSDLDACQIQLVLAPPAAIPRAFAELAGERMDTQTGELNNAAMLTFGDYPGTTPGEAIVWPPLLYIVEWGIGGHKTRAEVDAVNGATVNLTASFVRVFGALSLDGMANAPGTSGIYTLAAFVGPGYPRQGSAQRTVFIEALESNATSETFAIPPYAKDVTVLGNLVNNATVAYINFYQDPDMNFPVAVYLVTGNQPGPFRVPNAGAYFTITSGMGSLTSFAACFGLSI